MRLHAGPGRGGRGLPWLVKPKYLLQKPLSTTLRNDYGDPNNFYEVLETIEENKDVTEANTQCIEGSEDEKTCKQKNNNLNDQRKMCEKIPNSKNLTVGINENGIAPDIGEKNLTLRQLYGKRGRKNITHSHQRNIIKINQLPTNWNLIREKVRKYQSVG